MWKTTVIDNVVERWARAGRTNFVQKEFGKTEFVAIDRIPKRLSNQEAWEIEYRRRPYMARWSDEKVRDRWDEVMLFNLLAFVKGSPVTVLRPAIHENMQRFTHLMQETAHRGLALPFFKPTLERFHAATHRLNLPDLLIEPWLAELWASRRQPSEATEREEYAIQSQDGRVPY